MIEWSEEQLAFQAAVRRFIEAEIVPNLEELEHGDTPPYEVLRKLYDTFGIAEMQRARFKSLMKQDGAEKAAAPTEEREGSGETLAMQLILTLELSRYCPGMVTAMGVSVGLTSAAILGRGTRAQKERWALPLLTFEKIGAWAITEPGSGSDAFGGMRASARRDGEGGYILNGNKTFITNGPFADTIVFICKLDDGSEPKDRKLLSFVLDRGTPGLTQS
ncbi:MAG: acyl-CoA dehydrogenase family protein, partial [Deltaproteobacteria bacterium]|nr:acyl-CoA dehydrogenase family protein [Deltaproteobacteria bacterium]